MREVCASERRALASVGVSVLTFSAKESLVGAAGALAIAGRGVVDWERR